MLAGRPPFRGGSMAETLRKVQQEAPPPLRDVDREPATICAKALADYREALRLAPPDWDKREEVERHIRDLEKK